MAGFIQVLIGGLTLSGAYFLLAAGVTLVFGQTRIINFAHGQFFVGAALSAWWLVENGVPLVFAIVIAIIAIAAIAALTEFVLLRRLHANPLAAFLVTLGLLTVLTQVTVSLFGTEPQQLNSPVQGTWNVGEVAIPKASVLVFALSALTGLALFAILRRLPVGRKVRAAAEDPEAAAHLGVNVRRIGAITFIAGSALAAWGGGLLAMIYPFSSNDGGVYLIKGFSAAIAGGLGSVEGALIASLVLGIGEQLGQAYWQAEWVPALSIALILGVLIVKPSGLFGKRQTVLHTGDGSLLPRRVSMPRWGVPLLLAGAVLMFFLPSFGITAEAQSLANLALIYTVLATAVGFLFRKAGFLSFGHGAFFGFGAYFAGLAGTKWGISFWPALPLAAITAGLAAAIVAVPAFRTRGFYFTIVTFAVADLFALAELNFSDFTGGTNGLTLLESPGSVLGLSFVTPAELYRLLFVLAALVLALVFFVDRSRFGRHLDSLRDNEPLARSLGLNAQMYKIVAFAFSGAIAGLGGALYMYQSVSIAPSLFTGFATIIFPLMVILGGSRALWGPPLGAFVLTFLPYWLDLGPSGTQYAYGIALILIMTFLPEGIGPGLLRLLKALVGRVTRTPPRPATPDEAPAPAAPNLTESQPKETTPT